MENWEKFNVGPEAMKMLYSTKQSGKVKQKKKKSPTGKNSGKMKRSQHNICLKAWEIG